MSSWTFESFESVRSAHRRGISSAGRRLGEEIGAIRPPEDPLFGELLLARLRSDGDLVREPGVQLGRYRVAELRGRGGMGTVYRGYDPELRRPVAIKVLHEYGPDALEAMRREARMLSRARHPNTVELFDVGHTLDGRAYLVMEFVDGPSLRKWLERCTCDWAELVAIFAQCAASLHAAHVEGIVHGDLKPENILLAPSDRPKVSDFGLARILKSGAESLTPSQDGKVAPRDGKRRVGGTAGYTAPELLEGELSTPASDQFAFCTTLHEVVFGRRPPLERRENPSPKIRGVPLRSLRPLLRRGLDPRPELRFASMRDLATALSRLRPGARRRATAFGIGMLGAVAALVAVDIDPAPPPDSCQRLAGEPWNEIWSSARRTEIEKTLRGSPAPYGVDVAPGILAKIDAFVSDAHRRQATLCEAPASPARERAVVCLETQRARLEHALTALESHDADTLERALTVLVELDPGADRCGGGGALREALRTARILMDLGRYDEARARVEAIRAHALQTEEFSSLAEATLLLGLIQREQGRYAESVASLEEALWTAHREGRDALVVDAAAALVRAQGLDLGQVDAAARYLSLAKSAAARLPDAQTGVLDRVQEANAVFAAVSGRYDDAITAFESLAQQRLQRPVPAPVAASRALVNAAQLAIANARYESAHDRLQRALELERSLYGHTHPRIAELHGLLSRTTLGLGDLENAAEHATRAVDVLERSLGAEHPTLISRLTDLAEVLQRQEDYQAAEVTLARARRLALASHGEHHPNVASAELDLGVLHHVQAHWEQARIHYERARLILQDALGPHHRRLAAPLVNLAQVLEELGNDRDALELHRRALQILRSSVGPDSVLLAGPMAGMGRASSRIGRHEEAIEHLERALELTRGTKQDVVLTADIEFALAKARFAVEGATPRVVELARAAHEFYQVDEKRFSTARAETEAFLRRMDGRVSVGRRVPGGGTGDARTPPVSVESTRPVVQDERRLDH